MYQFETSDSARIDSHAITNKYIAELADYKRLYACLAFHIFSPKTLLYQNRTTQTTESLKNGFRLSVFQQQEPWTAEQTNTEQHSAET